MPAIAVRRSVIPSYGGVPALNLQDIQDFVLAYMKNEYSPYSSDHGISIHALYKYGIRVPSSPSSLSRGRTLPPNSNRWVAIGTALLHPTNQPTTNVQLQANKDAHALKRLLRTLQLPPPALHHLIATITDFARLARFSRIRTKLQRLYAWQALAARLLNDQSLLAALWPLPRTGFVMPDAALEVCRRDLQETGASVFSSIRSVDDFTVKRSVGCRIEGKGVEGMRVERKVLDAFKLAAAAGEPNGAGKGWRHFHREYLAVEELSEMEHGARLVRKMSFERECGGCGTRHRHEVQLVVGPQDEMPGRPCELPAYQTLFPPGEVGGIGWIC
ncbi:hypothetical protein SLS56_005381 [Neofusicoccum ribis]|uniref:Uncharacterized protein n=1 Tax=Neofusicoccum ribis TaxID=45134 RepID=A0ABR3STJ7_9PEZI